MFKYLLPCESVSLISRRHIRLRTGAGALSPLDPPSSSSSSTTARETRPAPNSMTLSYGIDNIPSLKDLQTEPTVWQCETVSEAWRQFHQLHHEVCRGDPLRSSKMRSHDLKGLAMCTAHLEVLHLLSLLPPLMRNDLIHHEDFVLEELEEIYLHAGQDVEARGGRWLVRLDPPTNEELQSFLRRLGRFGADGRSAVPCTSHRASVWRGKNGEFLGVTVRVGKYVPNAAQALVPLAEKGSLLIISKAGKGKTTLLRDLSSALAQLPEQYRVTVVDTSGEIGGDGPLPLAFLGRCRRMQVPTRTEQGAKMVEVIQNHSPEYLIVDELATSEEADAAWSITQRGVRVVASCHGENLVGLLQNRELNLLVGGAAQAFLSNEERRLRNKLKKTILERPHSSPFTFVLELQDRNEGYLYYDVNKAVDVLLDGQDAKRDVTIGCEVRLDQPLPERIRRMALKEKSNPFFNSLPNSSSSSVTEEVDSEGYTTSKIQEKNHNSNTKQNYRKGNKYRKSDSELYSELSSFL